MWLNFKNITDYAEENINQRHFREGMIIVSNNYVIKCGKSASKFKTIALVEIEINKWS